MKKKIKIAIEVILLVIFLVLILIECRKTCYFIRNHYLSMKNGKGEYSFTFPFINKSIQNDTFFTIAIGRNILKNGITNFDELTIHGKLKFPHSGIFDILITVIYKLAGFRRNLYLCNFYCNVNICKLSYNILQKYKRHKNFYLFCYRYILFV